MKGIINFLYILCNETWWYNLFNTQDKIFLNIIYQWQEEKTAVVNIHARHFKGCKGHSYFWMVARIRSEPLVKRFQFYVDHQDAIWLLWELVANFSNIVKSFTQIKIKIYLLFTKINSKVNLMKDFNNRKQWKNFNKLVGIGIN